MGRTVSVLSSVALAMVLSLVLVLFTGASTQHGGPTAAAQTVPVKPNFVFILVDDMRKDDQIDNLKYMPQTRSVLKNAGMTFSNAFVSNALCCPSRATIMRGQYSHNSGVWTNTNSLVGGWEAYKKYEQDNLATRLHDAGYSTALLGKYLNQYQGTSVPDKWDKWFASYNYNSFDYDVNDNGAKVHFGTARDDYHTDVLRRETVTFIGNQAVQGNPFFAYVAPIAPHMPATPAPRDAHTYDGEKALRLPSFDERNVSDKPPWISSLSRLSTEQIASINKRHENRVESLQAVDDLVAAVVNELEYRGVLSNTYIFFTSDNGWHHGEHRIAREKWRPYEEDIRVPLIVRGPGIAAGSTTNSLALNTDYLPTFTDLAGIETPDYVDGRSLRPVLEGSVTSWRDAILVEGPKRDSVDGLPAPAYYGIRTASTSKKYVEYEGGRRELYNLEVDPYELVNRYNPDSPPAGLVSRLRALKSCSADTCRTAENGS